MNTLEPGEAFRQWEAMLRPEVVRGRLIRAGLFSLAYELLETAVVGRLQDFYADWEDGKFRPGQDYRSEVLVLDPKSKEDPLRSSLAWLVKSDVISEADRDTFWSVKNARNKVAHELVQIVGGSEPEVFATYFATILNLTNQIQRWWVINLDVATDPAWDGEEIDPNEVTHGSAMIMQILVDVALGDDDLAGKHLEAFQAELRKRRRGEP